MLQWDGSVFTFDPQRARSHLECLKAAGVGWLGVDGVNLLEPMAFDLEEVVSRTGAWMDELGFRVSSFHFAGPTIAPLAEGQDAVIRNFMRNVEIFPRWKPRAFVIHAGWILGQNSVAGIKAGIAAECARHGAAAIADTLAANLKQLAQAVAPHGIRLALETMGKLLLPFGGEEDLPRLIQAVDEPNVGYCLDAGHAHMCGESVVAWVSRCGARLFETHFHDNRGQGRDEHMPVGFGTLSWIDVIQALDDAGFAGPVTFETTGWPLSDAAEGYRMAVAWWRACETLAARVKAKA